MAETYPASEVMALSSSRTQRGHIEDQTAERGPANVRVITADVATFDPADHGEGTPCDRVVSVEMLERRRRATRLRLARGRTGAGPSRRAGGRRP